MAEALQPVQSTARRTRPHDQAYCHQLVLIGLIVIVTIGFGWFVAGTLQNKLIALSGELIALMAADVASQLDILFVEHCWDVQFLANADPSGSWGASFSNLLQTFKQTHFSYLWIGVTDSSGWVVRSTNPATIGYGAHATGWYMAARERRAVHFGDAQCDELTGGRDAVSFTASLDRHSARPGQPSFAGVVSTRVEVQTIERTVTETLRSFQRSGSFFRTIEYQIFRENGIAFIDSDLLHKENLNLRMMGLLSSLLSQSGNPSYVEEEHPRRQVSVVTGYARTRGYGQFPNPGWTVLFRVDRAEVLAPLDRFLWVAGGPGLLLLVPMTIQLRATGRAQAKWIEAEEERTRSRENERRLRSILEAEPEGVLVIGRNDWVLQISLAGCVFPV